MNAINHKKLVIDFDEWEPFAKISTDEFDELIHKIKNKELLAHCGNVKLSVIETNLLKGDEQ